MNAKLASVLTPIAAWALNLACPVVPAWVWSALIVAVLNGDITLAHITKFMEAHGVKTYSSPADFPNPPPGEDLPPGTTNTNMLVGQPSDDEFPKEVKSG